MSQDALAALLSRAPPRFASWNVPANAVELAKRVAAAPPIEYADQTVRLRIPSDPDAQRAVIVTYRVEVPPGTQVRTRTDSGSTTIRGVDGIGRRSPANQSRHTALTNVFTGRPARGIVNRFIREIGPMSDAAPRFPLATAAVMPLRAAAESRGSGSFSPLWSGQNASGCREIPAAELTTALFSG